MRETIVVGAALLVVAGCAGRAPRPGLLGPEIEIALDEGRAAERPLTPPPTFELLMRIDPQLAAWRPVRLRFLLAQPGHVVLTVYAVDDRGHPGAVLKRIDRVYAPEMIASESGDAGLTKWVVEELGDVPVQRAPVFIGVYCPEKSSDPRLWASSNDTGNVFQRDADPSLPLDHLRVRRTPKLRVTVAPADAP